MTVNAGGGCADADGSDASGNEDTAIPLSISSALTDTDGSETLSIIDLRRSAGRHAVGGDGQRRRQLDADPGPAVGPDDHAAGELRRRLHADGDGDRDGRHGGRHPTIDTVAGDGWPGVRCADADGPTASGNEDTAIALSISSALTDTDGSETLSITISGVPAGATLSAGHATTATAAGR